MTRLSISCVNCRREWRVVSTFTVYEQQAVESRPCPACGAYTLCCRTPDQSGRGRRPLWDRQPVAPVTKAG